MEMELTVAHEFLPKRRSTRSAIVMDQFGIDFEHGLHVIADNFRISNTPGDVVLCTGQSGSGKSSLLRAMSRTLRNESGGDETVIDVATISPGDQLLIDRLPGSEAEAMHALSQCGLGEAHLMLRTPQELSDGQRYRFQLALGICSGAPWLLADEFTATLDRTLAKLVAFNVRRLADRTGRGFLLATTHQDIMEDLAPDVHVHCHLSGEIDVARSPSNDGDARQDAAVKKKEPANCRLPANCGSARRPESIGRTLLAGITEVTISDRRDS